MRKFDLDAFQRYYDPSIHQIGDVLPDWDNGLYLERYPRNTEVQYLVIIHNGMLLVQSTDWEPPDIWIKIKP